MTRYYVKHWVSKLADPKIARLPDWQWRRLAEFELLAGQEDADGKLPSVDDICWALHLAPARVEEALHELSKVGAVHQENDGSWYITGWNRTQDSSSKERTERWRERENRRHSDGHGDGDDSSSSSSSDSLSLILKTYESEIGALTKTIAEDLEIALEKYPEEWIVEALKASARNNARSWSYANAILKRWKVDGFKSQRGDSGNGKGGASQPPRRTGAIERMKARIANGEPI